MLKAGPERGVAGEMEEGVADEDGGRVAGREKDLEDLEAEGYGVTDGAGHFVEEDVAVG